MNISVEWWRQLSQEWKNAFAETLFKHSNEPTQNELAQLFSSTALRFAGPRAAFPNMSFSLSDLSALATLTNLEILVVIHHDMETVKELHLLAGLKSLFLLDNKISSLNGIENLTNIEQLYVQHNNIESLAPLEKLTKLKEVYVHDNKLSSLDGLNESHAQTLQQFVCLPNKNLPPKELVRVERELYIRCKSI